MTEVEKIARAMAKSVGWEMWDTATNCTHTPDGSEPDDERDYWRGLAQAALAASAPKVQMTDAEIDAIASDAVKAGKLSWVGYKQDQEGVYTVPVLSPSNYQFARAILARSAPNAELVAALKLARAHLDWSLDGQEFRTIAGKIDKALAAVGEA